MWFWYCWWLKSGDHQLRLVVYPTIYKVLYIPGGCFGISAINSIVLHPSVPWKYQANTWNQFKGHLIWPSSSFTGQWVIKAGHFPWGGIGGGPLSFPIGPKFLLHHPFSCHKKKNFPQIRHYMTPQTMQCLRGNPWRFTIHFKHQVWSPPKMATPEMFRASPLPRIYSNLPPKKKNMRKVEPVDLARRPNSQKHPNLRFGPMTWICIWPRCMEKGKSLKSSWNHGWLNKLILSWICIC